jgi:hypothetical protein
VGAPIEARFEGGELWFVATISAVHEGGTTVDVAYADGDFEANVSVGLVRHRRQTGSALAAAGNLLPTDNVEDTAQHEGSDSDSVEPELCGIDDSEV